MSSLPASALFRRPSIGTKWPWRCLFAMTSSARLLLCLVPLAALAACSVPEHQVLVSAQFPPGTGDVNANSEPQSPNSLPVGAANWAATPFATQPNFLSFKIGGR